MMTEYTEYNGEILSRYEWDGGFRCSNNKQTRKAQQSRRQEIEKGLAKIVKFD
jgi:hypothetical protein